jgi:hypothetical protein
MRPRSCLSVPAALLVLLMTACPAGADDSPDALTVDPGGGAAPVKFSLDQIRQQFSAVARPVQYDSHGQHHTSTCVPMLSLLQAAGVSSQIKMDPTADPKTKHHALRLAILVSASDGYAVAFSLPELLPDIGNRPVWLALDQDGKSLPETDQPVRLVVPDDAKPARWIHGVDRITVIDLTPHPTTAPSNP